MKEDFYNIWHPFTNEKKCLQKINILSGKDEFLFDKNGKKYIDLIASWWTNIHGHCNKKIQKAIKLQIQKLDHVIFSDFTHDSAIELGLKLQKITNNNFYKFFFSDNGSTSVEVALKIAYQYYQNRKENRKIFISFEGGYHGDTFGSMSISKKSGFFNLFSDLLFEVKFSPYPATWEDDLDRKNKEEICLNALEDLFKKYKNAICGLIIEPLIQGASGMRFSSIEFNNKILELCKKYEIISIFDEVMTGFGRTGKFFAYQNLKHSPDIISISKGITGGFLPLGVTCVAKFIYEEFYQDDNAKMFLHGHSYTGNPIICATANANIDLFNNELFNKIKKIELLYAKFYRKNKNNNKIEKIRFLGSILAFDLKIKDFNKEDFKNQCHRAGMIIRPLNNSVYFLPPYCINLKNLRFSLEKIIEIINLL